MIFGEDRYSNYFVVTNLQDKKIDKFNIFKKEDWSSAYQNVEKELTKEPLKISKGNNIKNLNEQKKKKFKVFFVSIDPERDSPSVIKNYLDTFENQMFEITGDPKKVFLLSQSWGVLSEKIFNEDGNYLINHSSSVLLLKDGKYLYRINHHAKYKDMFRVIDKYLR